MHLKQIKLSGFKSFVDVALVPLRHQITGIVGPNGCGKSNIIDAVRWVLGESSARYLRGEGAADVIFNGAAERKPVGQAAVELIFDNTSGKFGGAYAAYQEIAVRRVIDREGQSNYFLNGKRCRRRDVTDIFLGTGLSPRSYAVIEQGMIARLVEAKPEDLRHYLEEAAGVAKYKERRKEASLRLENTRQNLLRLDDILSELTKQVEQLHAESQVAETYRSLKQQERDAQFSMLCLRWQALQKESVEKEKLVQQAARIVEEKESIYQAEKQTIAQLQREQQEANQLSQQLQQKCYEASSEQKEAERLLEQHIAKCEHLKTKQTQLTEQQNVAIDDCLQAEKKQDELKTLCSQLREAFNSIEGEEKKAKQTFEQLEKNYHEKQTAWEKAWGSLQALQKEQQQTAESHKLLEYRIQQLREKLALPQDDGSSLAMQNIDKALQALVAEEKIVATKMTSVDEGLKQETASLNVEQEKLAVLKKDSAALINELQQAQKEQWQLEAAYNAALASENANENTPDSFKNLPQCFEHIVVDSGWEYAVEIVLKHYLSGYACDGWEALIETLEQVNNAQFSVINNTFSEQVESRYPSLWDKVKTNWKLQPLLGKVYIAQSRQEAWERLPELKSHESLITTDGLWLSPHTLHFFPTTAQKKSLLKEKQRLEALKKEVLKKEQKLETAIVSVETQENKVNESLAKHATLKQETQQLQHELVKIQTAKTLQESQYKHEQAKQKQQALEWEKLIDEEKRLVQQLEDTAKKVSEVEQAYRTSANEAEELKATWQALREQSQVAQKNYQDVHAQAISSQANLTMQQERLKVADEALAKAKSQPERLKGEMDRLNQELAQLTKVIPDLEIKSVEHREQLVAIEKAADEAKVKAELIFQSWEEKQTALSIFEDELRNVQQKAQDQRLNYQALLTRQEDLTAECEQQDIAVETLDKPLDAKLTLAALKKQLTSLHQEIKALGPVNLVAIEAYAKQQEKQQYLQQQKDDLESAIEQLVLAIKTIDKESRFRLEETFNAANKHFSILFPELFGGGKAFLELTDDDVLAAGIRVFAQPPGKRNNTIQLLSGGEKTLTAIALMFSFFQLNPAPFCILDEVDAPLDDANVDRFCQLIKKISADVQFILITHNKLTMSIAEQLVGVTMREPGVSKFVTVSMKEVEEVS